jgi:glycosyltransferase involved in cell wall biosynthesis
LTKVLVIEPSGQLWGSERALLDIVGLLPDTEVWVCCPPATSLLQELQRRGIGALPWFVSDLHKKSRWVRLKAALGVLLACIKLKPDVIHVNQAGAYKTALLASKILRVPLVCHVRLFEEVPYLAKQPQHVRRISALIAVSNSIAAAIRSEPSLQHIALHTLYDGYVRQSQNTKGHRRIDNQIICLGRLEWRKGQDIALEAAKLLGKTISLLVVGDGQRDFTVELKSRFSGLTNVVWHGFATEPMPLLLSSTVLVCPSHLEPLGRVVFEAWDAGCLPVVFAGSGGAAEIIEQSGGGLAYTEQSAQCLASVLEHALASSETERPRMIESGRTWMAEHCDARKNGAVLASILAEAAGKTPQAIGVNP